MVETYKKIEGFENYSVSDHGNVRNDKRGSMLTITANEYGYIRVFLYIDNKKHAKFVHQLVALAFIPNLDNKKTVDHIDNDKINNNINNLRWATKNEQQMNTRIAKNNTTGVKGVLWNKSNNKWKAVITMNGKKIHLGYFVNKEDAINIRVQKAKDEFGEYINKCELVINV